MEMKHTPGPWRFYTEPQPNGCPIVGAKGLMIAMLAHSIKYDDQHETAIANARLIAAAPDLLDAQTMGASLNTPDFLDWIADRLVHVYGEPEGIDFVSSLRERANAGRAAIAKATGTQP